MDQEISHKELQALFRRHQKGGLEAKEELLFRVEIQRFPELAQQLIEWDQLVEDTLLSRAEAFPIRSSGRSTMHAEWDKLDSESSDSDQFPIFHPGSSKDELLSRIPGDLLEPKEDYENVVFQNLDKGEDVSTFLIHLKDQLPEEVHKKVIEQFVILQGHCIVYMQEKEIELAPGDYFRIPILNPHSVRVTSSEPCVFLCQRITA